MLTTNLPVFPDKCGFYNKISEYYLTLLLSNLGVKYWY